MDEVILIFVKLPRKGWGVIELSSLNKRTIWPIFFQRSIHRFIKVLQKLRRRAWRDLKLQIFGAKGAENFEKMIGSIGKLALFWSFRGKFGQIWINMVILN